MPRQVHVLTIIQRHIINIELTIGLQAQLTYKIQKNADERIIGKELRPRLGALCAKAELEPEQAELRFVAPLAPPVRRAKGLRLSQPGRQEGSTDMGVWCGSSWSWRPNGL
jgi:hypothetical protein